MPGHPNWEGSFYERLTEYGEWNAEAFWRLHLELLNIAKSANPETPIDRNLAHMLLYIQQRVFSLISSHFNQNDIYKINNVNEEMLHEFMERFEMAVLGAITSEVLPESSFNLVNPLVQNA